MFNNNQDEMAANLLNAVSVILGYSNLVENRMQSAQNDVNAANDKQAKFLLQELGDSFAQQNAILAEMINLLRDIQSSINMLLEITAKGDAIIENSETNSDESSQRTTGTQPTYL